MMSGLPEIAISVRQPWAWAIIYAGKDIENRSWGPMNISRRQHIRGRVCIHAAKGMTKAEYADGAGFIERVTGKPCPRADELVRGAIIGTVVVKDGINERNPAAKSPWFMGPYGLVLQDPQPILVPVRVNGELGWFKWKTIDEPLPPPAKWMKVDDRLC